MQRKERKTKEKNCDKLDRYCGTGKKELFSEKVSKNLLQMCKKYIKERKKER